MNEDIVTDDELHGTHEPFTEIEKLDRLIDNLDEFYAKFYPDKNEKQN